MKNIKIIEQTKKVKFYNEECELFYILKLKNDLTKELSNSQKEIFNNICDSYNKLYEMQRKNLKDYFIEILKLLD